MENKAYRSIMLCSRATVATRSASHAIIIVNRRRSVPFSDRV